MPLSVIATPIGNTRDLSARAQELLLAAELVIGEEPKALRQILKAAGARPPRLDQLNEHSTGQDVQHLLEECRTHEVALVSDCGTPGFCDPGAELVDACHRAGVLVRAVPGPSSLMALLSVSGVRVNQFTFFGFLPPKRELRAAAWRDLMRFAMPSIVLETPYRLNRLLDELGELAPTRKCVLALDLTGETERVWRGTGKELSVKVPRVDAEPACLILPAGFDIRF